MNTVPPTDGTAARLHVARLTERFCRALIVPMDDLTRTLNIWSAPALTHNRRLQGLIVRMRTGYEQHPDLTRLARHLPPGEAARLRTWAKSQAQLTDEYAEALADFLADYTAFLGFCRRFHQILAATADLGMAMLEGQPEADGDGG